MKKIENERPGLGGGKRSRKGASDKPSRSERMLNLVSFLLKEREPVPWNYIKEKVDGYHRGSDPKSAERQFERDKSALKEIGVPIEYIAAPSASASGYIIDDANCFMPELNLSPEEIVVLHVAANLHSERMGGRMNTSLKAALQKMLFDAEPEALMVCERKPDYYMANYSAPEPARLTAAIEALTDAILRRRLVRFTYYSMTADRSEMRQVEPYGIARHNGYWYLAGRCLARNDVRVFRLDRITSEVEVNAQGGAGPDYEVPAGFRVADFVGRPAWELPSEEEWMFDEPQVVKIHLAVEAVWRLTGRLGERSVLKQNDDGSAVLTISGVRTPQPLIRWILRYGDQAEILSPAVVRRMMVETLLRMRSFYPPPDQGATGEKDDTPMGEVP